MKKILVLSGLSGSGNTTIIKELIDLDYLVLTSLKSQNYYEVLDIMINSSGNTKIAVFLNISESYDIKYNAILKIKKNNTNIKFIQIFLRAMDRVLINRFQESRKIHPYIKNIDKNVGIECAIKKEKKISEKFSIDSDYIIDTTSLTPNELVKLFKSCVNESRKFTINIFSFGFKYGLYQYSDYVFDVRFLSNPYYLDNLKNKSGLDKEVQDYVFSDKDAVKFLNSILEILLLIIPRFQEVNKDSISISLGCTGGKHRSVSFVEKIAKNLETIVGSKYDINKIHLEKEKGKWND